MLDGAAAQHLTAQLERLRGAGTAVVVFEHRAAAFDGLEDVQRYALAAGELTPDESLPALPPVSYCRLFVEDLRVALDGQPVLRGIDLTLEGGQVVAVMGANGAGKTTLLRALVGLQPYGGRIAGVVGGTPAVPRLGLCFQNPDCQLFNASVRAEILFGTTATAARGYDTIVRLLGLARYADTPPLLLSEGEKKRLGLAILLMRPGLCGVCLDEPTLGQDPQGRRLLGRIIRQLAAAGYLCLVATHDLEWVKEWADRVVTLAGGRVAANLEAAAMKPRPGSGAYAGCLPGQRVEDACRAGLPA